MNHEERHFVGLRIISIASIWNGLFFGRGRRLGGVTPLSLPKASFNLGLLWREVAPSYFPFSLPPPTSSEPPLPGLEAVLSPWLLHPFCPSC